MGYIFRLSFANLRLRRLRTALTIIGIMIGIMSIVTMLTAGMGAKSTMIDEVEKVGNTREIMVYSFNTSRKDLLLTDAVVSKFEKLDDVAGVYPVLEADGQEKMGVYSGMVGLLGVPREYMETLTLEDGVIPESNGSRPKLLVGKGVKDNLYNSKTFTLYSESVRANESLVGKRFDFELQEDIADSKNEEKSDEDEEKEESEESLDKSSDSSDKAGEEEDKETASSSDADSEENESDKKESDKKSSSGAEESEENKEDKEDKEEEKEPVITKLNIVGETDNEYDYNIYTDIDTLKMFLKRQQVDRKVPGQPVDKHGNPYSFWTYNYIIVRADSVEDVEHLSKVIKDMGYQVQNNLETLNSVNRTISIVQLVLGAIGAIAGVVAIIGIINTMMTAVYDRIREIGLLKMLGADNDDISFMFLFESALLGGIGGALGIGLSFLIDLFLNKKLVQMMNMPEGTWIMSTPMWLVVLAFVLSIVVSVLAGAFPARWASKIKPLEAISS